MLVNVTPEFNKMSMRHRFLSRVLLVNEGVKECVAMGRGFAAHSFYKFTAAFPSDQGLKNCSQEVIEDRREVS